MNRVRSPRPSSGTTSTPINPTPSPSKRGRAYVSQSIEVRVPDIGNFHDIPVIEVLVKPGDHIKKGDSLIVLEGEKASMEIPSPAEGTVETVSVKPGENIAQGTPILMLTVQNAAAASEPAAAPPAPTPQAPTPQAASVDASQNPSTAAPTGSDAPIHASPAIRRFARELGVSLPALAGSGPHGRITRDDVQGFVKTALQNGAPGGLSAPFALPPWPRVDFAQFGEIERRPLPRVKKFSGPNLHRNWLSIPHITNYDEADVTELEAFRERINAEQARSGGPKLTMLAFLIKTSVAALVRFPEFNSSLDGDDLIYKRYFHIGFAADTPNGLVVPVIRNADRKGLVEIARESAELAAKAREGKLTLAEMQGGTFTISSIGSIGGTQFTQIVNAPEVAIFGATRAKIQPVWNGTAFLPRLMQPISVSYDHRVIDGAAAARFLAFFGALLGDLARLCL
ncbi:MAG: dihydrolipoyllysine-residue acetyltransferase [Vulcanimicrobiaceae bacterium]